MQVLSRETLDEMNRHLISRILVDGGADRCLDGQLVRSVAQGHERALKLPAIDGAPDFDEAMRAKVLSSPRHDDISPTAPIRASAQFGGKALVQNAHVENQGAWKLCSDYDEWERSPSTELVGLMSFALRSPDGASDRQVSTPMRRSKLCAVSGWTKRVSPIENDARGPQLLRIVFGLAPCPPDVHLDANDKGAYRRTSSSSGCLPASTKLQPAEMLVLSHRTRRGVSDARYAGFPSYERHRRLPRATRARAQLKAMSRLERLRPCRDRTVPCSARYFNCHLRIVGTCA